MKLEQHNTFGKRLRYILYLEGNSISKFSKVSGVSACYLSRIINDHKRPGFDKLINIVENLDVDTNVRWLLLGDEGE